LSTGLPEPPGYIEFISRDKEELEDEYAGFIIVDCFMIAMIISSLILEGLRGAKTAPVERIVSCGRELLHLLCFLLQLKVVLLSC